MKREDIQSWFEELIKRVASLPRIKSQYGSVCETQAAQEWATEAESALAAVFPESHATRQAWARIHKDPRARSIPEVFERFVGVFRGAYNQVRDNRLASLIDIVRLESEDELLDQAMSLARADYLVAATVIAGGALETHLRYYVDKHGLSFTGDGSISKYNGAVGQARKANPSLYSVTDGKLVESWGGLRNDAAHTPKEFNRTKDEVKLMIDGVRQFIARTT